MPAHFVKDPLARLDFAFDLKPESHGRGTDGDWLEPGETVTGYTLAAPDGLVVEDGGAVDGTITAWVSGGAPGAAYRVTCAFTTSRNRADRRAIVIEVKER